MLGDARKNLPRLLFSNIDAQQEQLVRFGNSLRGQHFALDVAFFARLGPNAVGSLECQ